VLLVWAIIEGAHGWTDPLVLGAFAASAVLLAGFVLWERHTPTPMLDITFFQNARFSAASGALMLTFFAMLGSLFLLTQFMQSVMGYSALQTGVRLLPMAAAQMVVAPLSAKLVERVGTKVIVATGLVTAAAGLLLASRLSAAATYTDVVVALVVLAAGLAMVMPPATESIMGSLPPAKAGVGSAVNDTTREVGAALGVAVLGSVMSSTYRPRVTEAISGFPVPDDAARAITDQVGAAMGIAGEIGGEPGRLLADAASSGFADGMSIAFVIGAVALLVGAVIVARFLPARSHDHEDDVPRPAAGGATVDDAPSPASPPVGTDGAGAEDRAPVAAPGANGSPADRVAAAGRATGEVAADGSPGDRVAVDER
jgi:Na+/melibiose symporter-like transporter